ncbi:MAG TPA: hypothetical protein VEX86_27645 [Longimicrobium sp.]|nr:hypothetical protein [Longimicrobium sp.]
MSLLGFQLALADLSASVRLCARVAADPDAALAGYDLTPLERRRLASAAGQHGMRVNATLYRYNRFITLSTVMPGTLHLLGDGARAVVDEFWAGRPPDRNMRRETAHFAALVVRMLDDGRLASPYLREVVAFETARYEVAVAPRADLLARVADAAERWPDGPLVPHPLVRVATFAHDPQPLLTHLAWKRPPPYDDVAEGEFHLLLDCREGPFTQRPLDARAAKLLCDAGDRDDAPRFEELEELLSDGLLVRADPATAGALHLLDPPAWKQATEAALERRWIHENATAAHRLPWH